MDSLLFALNVVLPIVLMMAVGYWLKTRGLMNTALVKQLNRLVFQLFLPAMLFLNIYKMETLSDMDPGFVVYVVIMVLTIFLLAAPAVMAGLMPRPIPMPISATPTVPAVDQELPMAMATMAHRR